MDKIDLNKILKREEQIQKISNWCKNFETNKSNLELKRGLYVFGLSGIGKTFLVNNLLKKLNYDVINYNAGDVRNKNVIETITKNYMSDTNVISMFRKEKKKMIIVMDEIDGMNSGDKGGINTLIKLIRPKKTKKQKLEETTNCPIICIGSYKIDKKIRELMKVCDLVELNKPTNVELDNIIKEMTPTTHERDRAKIIEYVNGDLRKLNNILKISSSFNINTLISDETSKNEITTFNSDIDNPDNVEGNTVNNSDNKSVNNSDNKSVNNSDNKSVNNTENNSENNDDNTALSTFLSKININQNTKNVIKYLFNNNITLSEHNNLISETDRTIIGLLWHENIVDLLSKFNKSESVNIYIEILKNMCFADYIDRITFQRQIWVFNEMSSIIKSINNNSLLHEFFKNSKNATGCVNNFKQTFPKENNSMLIYNPSEVRFTKVLTKYSTEYNNLTFLQNLCLEMMIDKEDLLYLFLYLRNHSSEENINLLIENYDITRLDINRMFRYLEKISYVLSDDEEE